MNLLLSIIKNNPQAVAETLDSSQLVFAQMVPRLLRREWQQMIITFAERWKQHECKFENIEEFCSRYARLVGREEEEEEEEKETEKKKENWKG